jgi:hypothetical protein
MKTASKIFFTALFIFITNLGFCGPAAPGGGGNPACWPICVPVDNGLVFLIVAAGLYGCKKLYDYQKKVKA